jgi:chromosome segregation ATPase
MESRIARIDERTNSIKESIEEMKHEQKETNDFIRDHCVKIGQLEATVEEMKDSEWKTTLKTIAINICATLATIVLIFERNGLI